MGAIHCYTTRAAKYHFVDKITDYYQPNTVLIQRGELCFQRLMSHANQFEFTLRPPKVLVRSYSPFTVICLAVHQWRC